MRRWKREHDKHGYVIDRRWGKPSEKRVAVEIIEKVLGLYRDQYFDLSVRHFHEKLGAEHGIGLSYTWVKRALQAAGLVAKKPDRRVHRRKRPRRPLPGMLLHIDGSHHQWFQDDRWYDLLVILLLFRENDTVTVQRLCHPTQDFILAKGNEISRKEKGADFVIRLDTSVARRPPAELSAAVHTAVLSF